MSIAKEIMNREINESVASLSIDDLAEMLADFDNSSITKLENVRHSSQRNLRRNGGKAEAVATESTIAITGDLATVPAKGQEINTGDSFIIAGQVNHIHAVVGIETRPDGKRDRRLHVIRDNGTEIMILERSIKAAISKDKTSRKIVQ